MAETSFLIAEINAANYNNNRLWNFMQSNNHVGIEIPIYENNKQIFISGSNQEIDIILDHVHEMATADHSKIIPVFIDYEGNPSVLDSLIQHSVISSNIFHLPQGEAWPPVDYLIQSNRRILLFVSGDFENNSRMLHKTNNYILRISADNYTGSSNLQLPDNINLELFLVDEFDKLLPQSPPNNQNRNLIPDYINFLLENWTKYGKRPNFIFVGQNIFNFDFILSQLGSFTWINGTVKASGKTLDKIYWRSPDVVATGGRFSFPYRGGEEISLSPFSAGYRMTPEHIIVTGEMEVPENYSIIAHPLRLSHGLVSSFSFEGSVTDTLNPLANFNGTNYSFSQDIERGIVLKLPEDASVNLGSPEKYGLRNSSFTVSCFIKFNEILEFGDNAVLGNYESEYRRGLHLILRSGHPYFGLWANDYISDEKLEPNIWYHLVWRYLVETGEQAIFLNGRNIGSSSGHPPFSGTGDIHLGSALSQGASLRGYIDDLHFWNRPLGVEEINRLALDEKISLRQKEPGSSFLKDNWSLTGIIFLFAVILTVITLLLWKKAPVKKHSTVSLPVNNAANQLLLFGGFKAINNVGNDISNQFTPKVKELFLFILFETLKNESGAAINNINKQLWEGLPEKKVTNNRAVTLNKLRKILNTINGIKIASHNGFLTIEMTHPFFCDYSEAFKLCQLPGGMNKQQLETFFLLVKKGRLLNGHYWQWLDETLGFTGNQIIDNLLKLASVYKKDNKPQLIDALTKRILEYDELNEEAIYLQIWTLQKDNNTHQAKFYFDSFRTKYMENIGEEYSMDFNQFVHYFSNHL